MKSTDSEIKQHLSVLIGLPLSIARRAADMLNLQFGSVREIDMKLGKSVGKKGTVGEFALHVQCPWRIDSPDKIITGRGDLFRIAETGEPFDSDDNTCYKFGMSLQDKKIGDLLQDFDPIIGSYANVTKSLIVEAVDADNFGGVIIYLFGGYRLVLFPSGSVGEDWRLLQPGTSEKHVVVSGSLIEFE
jgi:hypothetical protein